MSASRRNHFIFRLLLGRFASRVVGEKSWIWQVSSNGAACQISTRDAAVSVDFYGGCETGLENALKKFEAEFHQALTAVESGANPHTYSDVLSRLIWTLSARTRALRSNFEKVGSQVLAVMCESAKS